MRNQVRATVPSLMGALLLTGVLVACGSDDSGATSEDQGLIDEARDGVGVETVDSNAFLGDPNPEACEGGEYTIGADVFSSNEEFANAFVEGLQSAAEAMGCIELKVLYDEADPLQALANAETLASQGVDAITNLQVVAAANPGIMRVLDEAGIPVVAGAVPAPGATFLGVPDYKSGVDGGRFLATTYQERVPDGPTPWLLIGEFPDGGQLSLDRLNGIVDGIKEIIPDIPDEQIIRIDTKADPVNTLDRAKEQLNTIPEDAQILASAINDSTTYALFQAIDQAGRADNAHLMGIGGVNPGGLQFVCDNEAYVGTISHQPETWGSFMIPAAVARILDKPLPPTIDVPWVINTRDNMKQNYPDAPC